jgi:hypothetical protein
MSNPFKFFKRRREKEYMEVLNQSILDIRDHLTHPIDEYQRGIDCFICGAKPKMEFEEYSVVSVPDGKGGWEDGKLPICPPCYESLRTGMMLTGVGRVGRYADGVEYEVELKEAPQ